MAVHFPNAAAQVRVEIPNAAKAEGQQWEYKTITTNLDAEVNSGSKTLNTLGADGWEVCATASTESGGPYFILKRSVRGDGGGIGAAKRLE